MEKKRGKHIREKEGVQRINENGTSALGFNSTSSWGTKYRVIHKKLSHKTEDKMQEKRKMILQVDENLAHIQQQYSEYFCEKIDSKSAFL